MELKVFGHNKKILNMISRLATSDERSDIIDVIALVFLVVIS